MKQKPRFKNF